MSFSSSHDLLSTERSRNIQHPDNNSKEIVLTSMSSTIFNMINAVVGAGVLALPWAFGQTGMVLGLILLLLFAILTIMSALMVNWCCDNQDARSYASVAESAFGYPGRIMVEVSKILFSWGACTGYLVIIGNELEIIMMLATGQTVWYTNRTVLLLIAVVCFILPLALLKSLNKLSFASLFSLVCVIFLTIAILIRVPYSSPCERAATGVYNCEKNICVKQFREDTAQFHNLTHCLIDCEKKPASSAATEGRTGGSLKYFLLKPSVFKALPLFVFAYNCQVQFVSYKYNMENSTPKRVVSMLCVTMLFCMLMYAINATGGYTTFCDRTLANLLDSFKGSDILILPARAALSISVACSYPLYSKAIREAIEVTFFNYEQSSAKKRTRYIVVTLLLVASMTIVAIVFQKLDQVLGLTGAIAGSALVYIIPGAAFAKLKTMDSRTFTAAAFGGCLFSFCGVVLAITCSVIIFV